MTQRNLFRQLLFAESLIALIPNEVDSFYGIPPGELLPKEFSPRILTDFIATRNQCWMENHKAY